MGRARMVLAVLGPCLVTFFVACDSEEAVEPEPIPLPARDAGQVDANADVPAVAPPADAGPDVEEPVDPCAAPDLVACLAFEDAVTDAKGTLTTSDVTSVTFVTGKTGKAASLADGSRIRFTASAALATPAVTLETFIRLAAPFSAEATVFEADERYVMTIEADRTLLCGSPGGAARGLQVTLDKWVHVACVFGGTSVIAYVDGAPGPSTGAFTGLPAPSPVVAEIGNDTPDGTRPFRGAIDTLRIFSDVRTAAELAQAAATP